jgi:hypothetical protein
MRPIIQSSMLLRAQTELPGGLSVATDEFHEGWNLAPKVNAQRLEKKVQSQGWNIVKIADGPMRSGVGETSQEAISSALKLALRRVSAYFNAAEVEHIELTQYPWFFLARVKVSPYRIQQDAILPISYEASLAPVVSRQRRLSPDSAALYPFFSSAMPQLKEMLISARSAHTGPQ